MSWTIFGVNFVIWGVVGLARLLSERLSKHKKRKKQPWSITKARVAALVPAHNEEQNVGKTITALKRILPANNIYVGSDASTDGTYRLSQKFGVQVHDIRPNRGKAGALEFMIRKYNLCKKYDAVLLVDADTEIDRRYLRYALPLFDDPNVAAVAGHGVSKWTPHKFPRWSMLFVSYRVKIYLLLQYLLRYGQTWKYINTSAIIPGFCSIYRTSILSKIDILAPNLIIEDFNMTFEVHHKNLGRVAYTPRAFGISHDPHNFTDYVKQVKRWNLGFWQTVRRHGFWPSLFSFMLLIFILENVAASIFFLALPFVLLWFVTHSFSVLFIELFEVGLLRFSVIDIAIGVFILDYLLTILVAYIEKRPMLLIYGLVFIPFRVIDSFLLLYALPLAFIVKSNGKWTSPERNL
jgi:poly-beta-1,6-N-acetyl-D-glucosamine synthase